MKQNTTTTATAVRGVTRVTPERARALYCLLELAAPLTEPEITVVCVLLRDYGNGEVALTCPRFMYQLL